MRNQGGYTYLLLLFFTATMGAALVQVAQVWHTMAVRDKEAELLFIGGEFQRAIKSYYNAFSGRGSRYPKALEDLLEDRRDGVVLRRHLRRVYRDPFTGNNEWGLVNAPDGSGIAGVFSLAAGAPIKEIGTPAPGKAASYASWRFVFVPGDAGAKPTLASNAPAGGVAQPAAPNLEQPTVEFVPGNNAPPVRPGKKLDCDQLRVRDADICENVALNHGAKEAQPCFASMQQRAAACAADTPLPALVFLP